MWPSISKNTFTKNPLKNVLHQVYNPESFDAHLIVLSARSAHSLPAWVLDWLERWATLRIIQSAALGVLKEGNSTDPMNPVCPELSRFIRRHHLNFIIDEGHVEKDAVKLLMDFVNERTAPLLMEQLSSVSLAIPHSFREYGINE
jgi:hypothetical protein